MTSTDENEDMKQMAQPRTPEASFAQIYMAITLAIVIAYSSSIESLRGGQWNGSYRELAVVVSEFLQLQEEDDPDHFVNQDIPGHALRIFKKRLSQMRRYGGYDVKQFSDRNQKYGVPAILACKLPAITRGDRIEWPAAASDTQPFSISIYFTFTQYVHFWCCWCALNNAISL